MALGAGATLALLGCGLGARSSAAPIDRDDAFIAELQERTFRWFWDVTPHENGLTPDRWPTRSFSSIAAIGFALTAYGVGAERGWITRHQALERTLNTLRFFHAAPQSDAHSNVTGYRGFFYHFLDMQTGRRFEQIELSSIDTTLLLGGVLFAQSYFNRNDAGETQARSIAEDIYARVEWDWMRPHPPLIGMGWTPERGGEWIAANWDAYNESALLHVLALASPTHPAPADAWSAWSANFERQWGARWGQPHLQFPPLFGHQYSHVWIDFRGIRDAFMAQKGIDYFENSRRATHAQQIYAIQNPGGFRDYGESVFGLTACDGPGDFTRDIDGRGRRFYGYAARGPSAEDDGTLAPTALGGSIPFAPDITIPALKEVRRRYGDSVYGRYGFVDAFNPTLRDTSFHPPAGRVLEGAGWVDVDYLGIDQGPIVCMIENWRSGLIWNVMRTNAHLRRGLERAGFHGGWLER